MKYSNRISLLLFLITSGTFFYSFKLSAQKIIITDVLVVGGGTGGTAAGIQSARSGAKTIIVEKTKWLGGMLTAAGVSCTDGNDLLPGGT
jgi:NADPH-dependent 2,4-dienoyl-CoA reductase/sulfur reductase-like enzyme